MRRKILLKLSSFLVCLSLLLPGSAALAAEGEQRLYWEGLFPPERGQVSLLSIGNEPAIKADIKRALENMEDEVVLQSYKISADQATAAELYALFYDVVYENPGLFYVRTALSVWSNGEIITRLNLTESYAYTDAATINRNRALIEAEVNAILATIHPAMTDAEKALAVHEWFVLQYAYNTPASQQNTPSEAHRIDGLFIDKTAVCQGYALGYIYVLQKLGIDAVYVASDVMNHAWNMIKLGDSWYHVDVTWDDPLVGGADKFGYAGHNNFLRSDAGIAATDHYGWDSPYTASADYANMFWKDVTTGIFYTNGKWYYKESAYSKNILSRAFTDTTAKTVYEVTARWPADEGYYYEGLFGIGVFDGRIYYNTATDIRSINTSGRGERTHSVPDLGGNQIFNMFIFGDTAHLAVGANYEAAPAVKTMTLEPVTHSVTKTGNSFAVSFPDEAESAGICWVAWYDDGQLLGMQSAPFAAGATDVTVSANVGTSTDVKVFVWGATLAPFYRAVPVK